jgi:ribosomal protein L19
MKSNNIIENIVREKKNIHYTKNNSFLDDDKIRSGFFIRVNYEHVTSPMPKTKKVIVSKHQFLGLCIAKKNNNLCSLLTLRNVIKRQPLENSFFVFSPLVENLDRIPSTKNKFSFKKAKLYFLNTKPLRYSKLRLDFDKLNIR